MNNIPRRGRAAGICAQAEYPDPVRAARVAVVVVLLAAAGPGVGMAATDDSGPIKLQYHVERTADPDVVRVTATVAYAPRSVTSVSLDPLDRARIESLEGFERRDDRLVWDGDGPASVTYTVSAVPDGSGDREESGGRGLGTADAADWTFVETSRVTFPVAYRYYGSDPGLERSFTTAEPGYAGPTVAFLGRHRTYETTADNQTIRLVVPRAAAFPRQKRIDVHRTLHGAGKMLDISAADTRVNVFVTTKPIRRGGVTYQDGGRDVQDVWVRDDMPVDTADNSWIHEYVHTRQAFETTTRMRWVSEASAEYYAAVLTLRQGRIEWARFRTHVRTETNADDRLTDPSTWSDTRTPYTKGRRVLAALDAKIVRRSDGDASLEDVLRRMNRHNGGVSYADFRRFVNAAAGSDLSGWLDRHVAGRAAPHVPDTPGRFTERPRRDADGDGLDAAREAAVGTNPFEADSDADELSDGREIAIGTDPTDHDTDGDGLRDGREIRLGTDPTARHSDDDRLPDGREVAVAADPTVWDTDGDGLGDAREIAIGTDPAVADTDGDGFGDRREIEAGTTPTAQTHWLVVWLAELF